MIKALRRFASLSSIDRGLIAEAAVLLTLAWVCLRMFRFPAVRRVMGSTGFFLPRTNRLASSTGVIVPVGWAITAIARRLPPLDNCLVRALAADAMLRRRGLDSEIRFGVRARGDGNKPLEAHAWVESGDDIVIGAIETLPDFATFSPLIR